MVVEGAKPSGVMRVLVLVLTFPVTFFLCGFGYFAIATYGEPGPMPYDLGLIAFSMVFAYMSAGCLVINAPIVLFIRKWLPSDRLTLIIPLSLVASILGLWASFGGYFTWVHGIILDGLGFDGVGSKSLWVRFSVCGVFPGLVMGVVYLLAIFIPVIIRKGRPN